MTFELKKRVVSHYRKNSKVVPCIQAAMFCVHTKILATISVLLMTTCAMANDQAIQHIARKQSLSVEEVLSVLATGCDSGNTSSMTRCGAFHFMIADFELNEAYTQLITQLNTKSSRSSLVLSQKAWVAFRDAACDYESEGWAGGTGRNMIIFSCKETHTVLRTKQLREYLLCKQPTCPGEW